MDPADGAVIGTGVLGSLENGFLDAPRHLEGADTYYQFCTAFPVGTALAQSWDPGLMEEFGRAIAAEMAEFHIDLWLAPGMNIHRNPLCGRNFEYYAEDPLLSGLLAAAVTRGVQADGTRGVTIKHFACNNQEDHRMGVDAALPSSILPATTRRITAWAWMPGYLSKPFGKSICAGLKLPSKRQPRQR